MTDAENSPEVESEEPDEPAPGFLASLSALLKLFFAPEPALETLYAGIWPRFVLCLTGAALLIPLVGNFLVDDSPRAQSLFLALNRYVELKPAEFRAYYFYAAGLGLFLWIIVASLLQRLLLRMQKVDVTLLDSIAALAYSAFPALCVILLRHLSELFANRRLLDFFELKQAAAVSEAYAPHAPLVYAGLTLCLLAAACWGVYLWSKCIELIAELPLPRIALTGSLLLIVPFFVVTAWLTILLVLETPPDVGPSLDHIRDSIEMQRSREEGLYEHP